MVVKSLGVTGHQDYPPPAGQPGPQPVWGCQGAHFQVGDIAEGNNPFARSAVDHYQRVLVNVVLPGIGEPRISAYSQSSKYQEQSVSISYVGVQTKGGDRQGKKQRKVYRNAVPV